MVDVVRMQALISHSSMLARHLPRFRNLLRLAVYWYLITEYGNPVAMTMLNK